MAQPLIGTASTDNPPGSRWCGRNLRWGRDPGCTYKDKVVVVSVPHDGGWEDWWRGGMVGYTPGGTAPPLRLSPCRPPGVVHMIIPRRKNLTIHGPWNGKGMPVTGLTADGKRGA